MISLFIAIAFAQTNKTAAPAGVETAIGAYQKCNDRTSSNLEWGVCGEDYLKQIDVQLTIAWKKALGSLGDKEARTPLLDEQRAWIKFKDASCWFYASGTFGRAGQVLHFFGCRGAIIKARIADLNSIYELSHQDELTR